MLRFPRVKTGAKTMNRRERQRGNRRLASCGRRLCPTSTHSHRSATVRCRAFTLMELLVVTAIIALLMAILIPTLSRARKHAKAMVCQSRLRQWGMALAAYTDDNQGRLPGSLSGFEGLWLLRGAFPRADDPNAPQDSFHHFRTRDIVCCPMATKPFPSNTRAISYSSGSTTSFGRTDELLVWRGSAFGAWEMTSPSPAFRGSYGFNQWLFQGFRQNWTMGTVVLPSGPSHGVRIVLDVLSLRGRTEIPVLLDATSPSSAPQHGHIPMSENGSPNGTSAFCLNRHRGWINGLFLDWSVRKVGVKELWTLPWSTEFNRAGPWTKAGGVAPGKWPQWMRSFKDY